MLETSDLHGAVHLPGDGRVLPGECTVALAKGALQAGASIVEGISVTQLVAGDPDHRGIRRINGVRTDHGDIYADWVVLAGNMWMRQLGLTIGVDIPVYPCEHHYVITRPIEGVTRNSPCTRDPDSGLYWRALDDGALKLGAFKKRSKPWQIGDEVPRDFAFSLLDPDWPDFSEPFKDHCHRLHGIGREDVVKFINGPEAFTPDNNFLLGQPFLTEGLFVMGGWNSAGIACAGGAGLYGAEWLEAGGMTMDLCSVDIRRFMPFHNGRKFLQERVSEVLGLHYQMAWPGRQMETSREVRASALLKKHKALNACFGESLGWERPLWYAPRGVAPVNEYSFGPQNWAPYVAGEVRACRENVALLDQSTFAKFMLQGKDACLALQSLCGADIDCSVGQTKYTGMFNKWGTFEADLTVLRIAEDAFYLVTGTAQQRKDFDWISKHLTDDCTVQLTDVTDDINVVSVMGPRARELMVPGTDADLCNDAFPFATFQEISVAGVEVRAVRISYVGELGWELHCPARRAPKLWAGLLDLGKRFKIRPVGSQAISTMRVEKAYRAIGHELSPDETPLEAGLAFAIDWDTPFLGREALQAQRELGIGKRLAAFVLDSPGEILWGGEPITWDGEICGYTTSATWSPTLGTAVGMGYVRPPRGGKVLVDHLKQGEFAIVNASGICPARIVLGAPYDPRRTKTLG